MLVVEHLDCLTRSIKKFVPTPTSWGLGTEMLFHWALCAYGNQWRNIVVVIKLCEAEMLMVLRRSCNVVMSSVRRGEENITHNSYIFWRSPQASHQAEVAGVSRITIPTIGNLIDSCNIYSPDRKELIQISPPLVNTEFGFDYFVCL